MSNVVSWSGDPVDDREITIFATLRPGSYTIMCAAYKGGDEGPFTLTVRSNYTVKTNQIWPPLWKKQGKEGPEKTLKDKLLERGMKVAQKAQEKALQAANAAKNAAKKKLAENTDWVTAPVEEEKGETKRPATEKEKQLERVMKAREVWK